MCVENLWKSFPCLNFINNNFNTRALIDNIVNEEITPSMFIYYLMCSYQGHDDLSCVRDGVPTQHDFEKPKRSLQKRDQLSMVCHCWQYLLKKSNGSSKFDTIYPFRDLYKESCRFGLHTHLDGSDKPHSLHFIKVYYFSRSIKTLSLNLSLSNTNTW